MAKLSGKVIDLGQRHTADTLFRKKSNKSIENFSKETVSQECREAAAKDPIQPRVHTVVSRTEQRLRSNKRNKSRKNKDKGLAAGEAENRSKEFITRGKQKDKGTDKPPMSYSPVSQGADCIYGKNQISRVKTSHGSYRNGVRK